MASTVLGISSTSNNEADTLSRNSTSQISKLKINLNDVVVTGDSIVQTLIQSPGALNKSNQISTTIILSDNLDNLAKTCSSSNETNEIANETNEPSRLQQQQAKFKIRYHYNTYSNNYQNYNDENCTRTTATTTTTTTTNMSDSSDSTDSAATSPILSNDDSNIASPTSLINDFSNLDPLENVEVQNSNAFKFSTIIVNESPDTTSSSSSTDIKAIIKSTNINNRMTPSSTKETLRRHYYNAPPLLPISHQETDEMMKDLAINGKSIEHFSDETKHEQPIATVKKEKKRVSFNDSLLQVHLIPNLSSANSLSIEKFKYQLKTTTITMENNDNFEENDVNEVHNDNSYDYNKYDNYNNSSSSSTNNKLNFSFYKQNNEENTITVNNDENLSNPNRTYLLSSALISSLQNNNISNNETTTTIIPNSKLYRTTLFKTFQDTTNETTSTSNTKRIASATNRENSFIRNNSAHFKTDNNNNKNNINNNKKKETANFRIGSSSISSTSSTSSSTSSSNHPSIINYQNQRSYSSILASTFSSNYSFTKQNPQVQIQLQSNNLSIPFHSSTLMPPSTSIIIDDKSAAAATTNSKRSYLPNNNHNHESTTTTQASSAGAATNSSTGAKNENAILRLNSGTPNKSTLSLSNHNKTNSNSTTTNNNNNNNNNNTEVHQSLAMSFELTPQLKFLSNLKTPKQTASLFINSTELKDLVQEEKPHVHKDEVKVQMQQNTTNRNNNNNTNETLTAPIIANLSAGLFKQKFSNKPGSTKYIFLKSDDKQEINVTPSTFSSNHSNTLNKSYSSSKINLNNNSASIMTTTTATPLSGHSSIDGMLKLNQELTRDTRATPTPPNYYNPTAKNLAMSTVNQLFAFKDVNYYVQNSSSKAIRKYHQNSSNNHKSSSFSKPSSSINTTTPPTTNTSNNNNNNNSEVTTIKLASFTQNSSPSSATELRQTKSALPLLRSSFKNSSHILTNNTINNVDLNQRSSSTITPIPTSTVELTTTKNLNNCFNNLSYKLINTPMMGNLTKAKTFLYNQNANQSINSMFDKRIKENSNEKNSF